MRNLVKMLRLHEGVKPHVYYDTENLATIGVGRCIDESSIGLSDDEIDYLLGNDISRVEQEAIANFDWYKGLDSVRQEAILNLLFNLGLTRFLGFKKAIDAMSKNDTSLAAKEFLDSKWARQVGNRAIQVAHMIRTGEYPDEFKPESD